MADRNITVHPDERFCWQELADAIEKTSIAEEKT
jgi:hypothetical protein